ncbi:unnamed protein product [Nesidiocoris tenuis]|uniref:Carboxypeptidase n=1 Tax=Nesidiocoris tenuis TaxID=355587 RepID=A0A6H5HLJ5_9HEMI|nr:unnamed protein product [Nesidiocoris tenuis]
MPTVFIVVECVAPSKLYTSSQHPISLISMAGPFVCSIFSSIQNIGSIGRLLNFCTSSIVQVTSMVRFTPLYAHSRCPDCLAESKVRAGQMARQITRFESYAGKYIPALGYTIHERNPHAELKINLAGLAIGNGLVDPKNMLAYSDYLPQLGLIDDNAMLILKKLERNALDLINQEKFSDAADARIRILVMFQNISGLINVYDYTKNDNSSTITLYSGPIGQYLNQTKVKRALHVGSKPFSDGNVPAAILHEDIAKSVAPWLVTLMENYRVMLYNGQLDIIVAYPLTVNFVKRLKWSGAEEYNNASRQIWYVDGKIAGYVKTAKNFTEVLVRNSGHMVPSDQPVWALDLITRFTRKIPFDQPLVGNRKRVRVTA